MEAIGSKVLFLILWVCVAVSPCFGGGGEDSSTSGFSKSGIVLVISGIILLIISLVGLWRFCKRMKARQSTEAADHDTVLATVTPNVNQTQEPPTYPTTEMTHTSYSCPPQPYPFNNGTASYPYAYANHGLVK